jgi:hypothetical protein
VRLLVRYALDEHRRRIRLRLSRGRTSVPFDVTLDGCRCFADEQRWSPPRDRRFTNERTGGSRRISNRSGCFACGLDRELSEAARLEAAAHAGLQRGAFAARTFDERDEIAAHDPMRSTYIARRRALIARISLSLQP